VFSFAWPWMVVLLAVPFVVRALGRRTKKKHALRAPEMFFPHVERLKTLFPPQQRETANRLQLIVLGLIWLCLTGALMGPQLVDQLAPFQDKGYDLMLAVDLSESMRALDYMKDNQPVGRLDVVKSVVDDFVIQRRGDRIGLVLFGSNAYLHVPLTLDVVSVQKMLDNAQAGEAGDQTAIGDAIGLAVSNLRNRPEKSRVIILLTDGGDNASTIPPLEAAKLAHEYGIRIYTIGVGTQGLVSIPDQSGAIGTAQFDLDEGLLQKIATITGGSYFRASDTQALRKVYAQINALEKTRADSQFYLIYKPLYRYPLGGAMALLLTLSLLPILRKHRRV
jgi:Ca-activated chloride channel family protein